jgi:hypothetical protein
MTVPLLAKVGQHKFRTCIKPIQTPIQGPLNEKSKENKTPKESVLLLLRREKGVGKTTATANIECLLLDWL